MFWETLLSSSAGYTDAAKRVLFFARFEAAELRSISVEPAHLVLGLLRERRALFPRHSEIRERITKRFATVAATPTTRFPDLSATSEAVLADAKSAAGEMRAVDAEHIFSSLLRSSDKALLDILRRGGLDVDALRKSG